MVATHAVRCAVVVVFSVASWCSFSPAQDSASWPGVPDDRIAKGIAKATEGLPCDGNIRRLPVDLFGKEYRGACVDGVSVWTWANGTDLPKNPMVRKGGKARFSVFVVVVNGRKVQTSIVRDDFYVVDFDPKNPNDSSHGKAAPTLDPQYVVAENAAVSSDIAQFTAKSAFDGGAVSPGGALSGFLYFGKVAGIYLWLDYKPRSWTDKIIAIPLGNWPIETGLLPQ